jgi:hypothetical protein
MVLFTMTLVLYHPNDMAVVLIAIPIRLTLGSPGTIPTSMTHLLARPVRQL